MCACDDTRIYTFNNTMYIIFPVVRQQNKKQRQRGTKEGGRKTQGRHREQRRFGLPSKFIVPLPRKKAQKETKEDDQRE